MMFCDVVRCCTKLYKGTFYCEFLGDFFFLSLSGLGTQIPKWPERFSQSDLVIWVPEWPKIYKKKKREVSGRQNNCKEVVYSLQIFHGSRNGGL